MNTQTSRTDLAALLADTATAIGSISEAEYPIPARSSYLGPALGPLSRAPQVIETLNNQLEALFEDALPSTPASLFTVASYAAAVGWLAESVAEFTAAVDHIRTRVTIPTMPPEALGDHTAQPAAGRTETIDFYLSSTEAALVNQAATATGLTSEDYLAALSLALVAESNLTDACQEICDGLLADAQYLRTEANTEIPLDGPEGLPAIVRALMAKTKDRT